MIRQHHQLNEHELEQTLGDSEGQLNLACCSPLGCKELDRTEELKKKKKDKTKHSKTQSARKRKCEQIYNYKAVTKKKSHDKEKNRT